MRDLFEKLYEEAVEQVGTDNLLKLVTVLDEKAIKALNLSGYERLAANNDYYFWFVDKFGDWY